MRISPRHRTVLIGLLGLGVAACRGADQRAADTTAGTAAAPAADDGGPYVYVTNEDGNDVTVIDSRTDSVVRTLEPGRRPRGVRLSPDGTHLIVAVSGSPKGGPGVDESKLPPPDRSKDGIAILDLATGAVQRLPGGHDPESFDITPDGKTIYVSNEDAGTATVLDVASGNVVGTVTVGEEPEGVSTRPDGKEVWVTSEGKGTVSAIDVGTNEVVATIRVGRRPRSVAFTPDGAKAYVPAEFGGTVTVVDANTHQVLKTIKIPGTNPRPMGSAMAPDGKRVYITNGRGGTVSVIDTGADSVIATFPVGQRPWGIAITPDGKKLYTANGPSNDVSVIDAATNTVIKRIPAGDSPWGVAISK